ncbi:MAG: helix-turn-helix domain-containing protein, partial [Putridiphycobacter sp.]|nr:helix-turn-helix domain-containing protein [Putridiphycobacter sp.]
YKATGNFEKANYFFEKYINTQSKLNALKGDLTAAMKAKEIENFKLEIEQQKIEKTKADNKMYTIVLVSMLAITILLLIVLRFYKIKRRNEIRFENLLSELEEPVTSTNLQETSEFLLEEIGVSAETKKEIVAGLEKLEEELYFLRQDCTAYNVAKKLKTNTSYLSKIVNHHYQKNFNTYINDLRIKYAILRLKNDKSFRAFAIQSIAEEVGYKSADSFVKYFKAETGLNPSFYIKQLEASRF